MQTDGGGRSVHNLITLRRKLRQAEIENLGLTPLRDKNIRWLNVAVHDSARVRRFESVGDLNPQIEQLRRLQRSPLDQMFQCRAFQILHGDESQPAFLADVVNGANIRMVQSGRRLCLAPEPAQGLLIFGDIVRQKFEGDKAPQPCVLGLVDHTHATAAKLLDNAVMR